MPAPLSRLVELGLSEYEARAYLAPPFAFTCNGLRDSPPSGIPTSKIYEVLGTHGQPRPGQALDEGDRHLYVPQNAKEFLDSQRSRFKETISALEEDISKMGGAPRGILPLDGAGAAKA
jgi:sugar-specific transcriptional regulator TrmB